MTASPTRPAATFRVTIRPKAWRDLRRATGLVTDGALADALFVTQPTVSRIMRGTTDPSNGFIGAAVATFAGRAKFDDLFTVIPAAKVAAR